MGKTFMLENIDKIKEILDNDGVIAFVTDTVWGLGCLPTSEKAVKRIYEIKQREVQKPLILMSSEPYHLLEYVKQPLSRLACELVKNYFPGALTLVLEKSEKTPCYLTSNRNTVGIRVPDNEIFQAICNGISGHVLATTSANLSHKPSAKTHEQVFENMKDCVDMVVPDYGYFAKGLESTVAGIFDDEIKIFRQGAVSLNC